jgi:hypothetical protein
MKIVVIECCDECPYFSNEYYDYNRICGKLNKLNEHPENSILQDCPLEEATSEQVEKMKAENGNQTH